MGEVGAWGGEGLEGAAVDYIRVGSTSSLLLLTVSVTLTKISHFKDWEGFGAPSDLVCPWSAAVS